MSSDHSLAESITGFRGLPVRVARTLFLNKLEACEHGTLHLRDPEGSRTVGETEEVVADLTVRDPQLYLRVVLGGAVAFGEAYRDGDWTSSNVVDLLEFFTINRSALEGGIENLNVLGPIRSLYHWNNKNTREGSRENIRAHYDIGNDFYELFLDETMTYSSAVFRTGDESLAAAQREKYDRLAERAGVQSGDHVLEVGSGWGGFATHLVENYDCRVTTTTISEEQHQWTEELVQERGLDETINVLKRDYRDLRGEYDRIVSVEMVEAVGEDYLPVYFEALDRLLKPEGTVALQSIRIQDQFYESYRGNVDFIQRYVFPGGHLPSLGKIQECLKETSFTISWFEDIGDDYAETLKRWKRRLMEQSDAVRNLGYDDEFLRLWEYYFSYCQAGFRTGLIGNLQLVLDKTRIH